MSNPSVSPSNPSSLAYVVHPKLYPNLKLNISSPSKTRKFVTNAPTAPYWKFPAPIIASASGPSASSNPTASAILAIASGTSHGCAQYDHYIGSDSKDSYANTCDYIAYFYDSKCFRPPLSDAERSLNLRRSGDRRLCQVEPFPLLQER